MFRPKLRFGTQSTRTFAAAVLSVLLLAACGKQAEPPVPTATPAPTFTPTVAAAQPTVDPAVAATLQAEAVATQQPAPAAGEAAPMATQASGEPQPVTDAQPTPPPADTPTPVVAAEVVINGSANVRGGPGTEYNILGAVDAGQRFPVKGRNDASTWWQIDFQGQDGWVFGELVTPQNTQAVALAVNIPAPPPATATPIPQPTPVPQPPPAEPPPAEQPPAEQPPAQPQGNYEFNKALLQRCDPNEGVTYVQGTTYKGGQPANGYQVAFSYAPDGPVVASVQSGPHQGYEGWNTGFYSHILSTDGAREGDWFFWIMDGGGQRISQIAHVHTDGSAGDGKCQQATIDFDS